MLGIHTEYASLPNTRRSPNFPDEREKYLSWPMLILVYFQASKTKQPHLLTVAFINSKFTYTISYITGRESQVVTST